MVRREQRTGHSMREAGAEHDKTCEEGGEAGKDFSWTEGTWHVSQHPVHRRSIQDIHRYSHAHMCRQVYVQECSDTGHGETACTALRKDLKVK